MNGGMPFPNKQQSHIFQTKVFFAPRQVSVSIVGMNGAVMKFGTLCELSENVLDCYAQITVF